jgi:hypothetical protein
VQFRVATVVVGERLTAIQVNLVLHPFGFDDLAEIADEVSVPEQRDLPLHRAQRVMSDPVEPEVGEFDAAQRALGFARARVGDRWRIRRHSQNVVDGGSDRSERHQRSDSDVAIDKLGPATEATDVDFVQLWCVWGFPDIDGTALTVLICCIVRYATTDSKDVHLELAVVPCSSYLGCCFVTPSR